MDAVQTPASFASVVHAAPADFVRHDSEFGGGTSARAAPALATTSPATIAAKMVRRSRMPYR